MSIKKVISNVGKCYEETKRVSGCYLKLAGLRLLAPSALKGPLDPILSPHPGSCDLPTPCHFQSHSQEAHSGHRVVNGMSSACTGAHK